MKRKSKQESKGHKVGKENKTVEGDITLDNMSIIVDDIENWRRVMEICATMCDECVFDCKPKGIGISIMDIGGTGAVKMFVPKKFFMDYYVDSRDSIGVNIKFLVDLNKQLRADNSLTIGMNSNVLTYSIIGEKRKNTYDLDIINTDNISNVLKRIPSVDYNVMINISIEELVDILKCSNKLSDYCNIIEKGGDLFFKSDDYSIGKFNTMINSDLVTGDTTGFNVRFNIKLALKFFSHLSNDSMVEIHMSKDSPMYVKLKGGYIKYNYWLAPVMDVNDTK